jgi:hypothetical protein
MRHDVMRVVWGSIQINFEAKNAWIMRMDYAHELCAWTMRGTDVTFGDLYAGQSTPRVELSAELAMSRIDE